MVREVKENFLKAMAIQGLNRRAYLDEEGRKKQEEHVELLCGWKKHSDLTTLNKG